MIGVPSWHDRNIGSRIRVLAAHVGPQRLYLVCRATLKSNTASPTCFQHRRLCLALLTQGIVVVQVDAKVPQLSWPSSTLLRRAFPQILSGLTCPSPVQTESAQLICRR